MASPKTMSMRIEVKEVFANGDERCELRLGTTEFDSVVNWKAVRNLDVATDEVTGETVLSFTRSTGNSGRLRR
jgi:hypothetical protein